MINTNIILFIPAKDEDASILDTLRNASNCEVIVVKDLDTLAEIAREKCVAVFVASTGEGETDTAIANHCAIRLPEVPLVRLLSDVENFTWQNADSLWYDQLTIAELRTDALTRLLHHVTHLYKKHALIQELESYKEIFEKNPRPLFIYEPTTLKFIKVNEAAVEKYGYSAGEFNNMSLFDIRPETEANRLRQFYEQNQMEGTTGLSWVHKLKDGSRITTLPSIREVNFRGKNRRLASIADITEYKELQSRLSVLEQALVSLKDAVLVCSPTADKKLVITRCNESYSDVFGFKTEDVVGKPLTDFTAQGMRLNHLQKIKSLLEVGTSGETETQNTCSCGRLLWVHSVYIPVSGAEEQSGHWIVLQRDITEKKVAEHRQKALTEEILQNNKELQQFSYITSHNLRAPLANLTSLLHLYNRENGSDPFNAVIVENFEKAVNNLNVTLNDLHRALVIRNNYNVQKTEISLKEIFHRVAESLQLQISQADATVHADFSEADTLIANRSYLQSIFLNLLLNSINYRAVNRPLQIDVKTETEEDFVKIIFSDNGSGIDLNRYGSRMFGLYQRFHTRTDGKGLGLFLVKSQINGLGGRIEVESEVNKGTTFYLYIQKSSL